MALQLPQQPNDPRVVLPQAPANPPPLADIYDAVSLKYGVLESANDVNRAVVYEHSAAHAVAAGGLLSCVNMYSNFSKVAPPWFAPVQQQLNRVEASLVTLKNAGNGNGNIYPFTIVPFNGTDPTAEPHNLPPPHQHYKHQHAFSSQLQPLSQRLWCPTCTWLCQCCC